MSTERSAQNGRYGGKISAFYLERRALIGPGDSARDFQTQAPRLCGNAAKESGRALTVGGRYVGHVQI